MNTIQLTVFQPGIYLKIASHLGNVPSNKCILQSKTNSPAMKSVSLQAKPSFGLQCLPLLKPRQLLPACLAGGKGMMDSDEGSPWKALEKAMAKFKGQSIEDVLREQIDKGEYSGDGGSGGKTPGGGGGGGSDGPEEGNFSEMLDEAIQVFLATFGLLFLYLYIINGEVLIKLIRDYMKYLFTGNKSVRLARFMLSCQRFFRRMSTKKSDGDPDWLEEAIVLTRTTWDSPAKSRPYTRSEDSDENFF